MKTMLVLAAAAAVATSAQAGEWRARDLTGAWSNASLTGLTRPDEFKTLVPSPEDAAKYEKAWRGKVPQADPEDTVGGLESEFWETDVPLAKIRGQVRTSWIISPANGQMPLTAAAKAEGKARREKMKTTFDDPEARPLGERCLETMGVPIFNGGFADNFQFVLAGDRLAILGEYDHGFREVRIGDKAHPPKSVRSWLGDSIGWWEGDTLVVETTNFRPEEVRIPGDPQGDMRTIERCTRTGPDELFYAFWIHAPGRLEQPVSGEMVFHRPNGPIYEFACHEGNYGLPNILSGGRQADREKAAAAASLTAANSTPTPAAPR